MKQANSSGDSPSIKMPVCSKTVYSIAMHSTILRGNDFALTWHETAVSHPIFFANLTVNDRLGILAPNRFEAVGAVTLIMAYVTAFYDRHRAIGNDFFAYPNYFTFQQQAPVAQYSMFDIWPQHRNVLIEDSADEFAAALTDRAISVLLLPERAAKDRKISAVYRHDLERQIERCFVYAMDGSLAEPDLTVTCTSDLLKSYALTVFDSVEKHDADAAAAKAQWLNTLPDNHIQQSFREITLAEALRCF